MTPLHLQPARIDRAVEGGPAVCKDDGAVEAACPDEKRWEARVARPQMRFDLLGIADGSEGERPVQPSARKVEQPREPAGIGAQIPACVRSAHVQRGNRNRGAAPPRKEDPSVAGERPEHRLAIGAIVESRRRRVSRSCMSRMPSVSLGRSRKSWTRGRSMRPSSTSRRGP